MIVLDTNVLSELMKPRPVTAVIEWVAEQPSSSLYTTSITQEFDAQIAAIARSVGAAIATRNLTDFEGLGLRLVDPWNR